MRSRRTPFGALSIRGKVLVSGIAVVSLLALFNSWYYPRRAERSALASLRVRGTDAASHLAVGVGIGLELHELDAVATAFDAAKRDPSLAYLMAADTAGKVFASFNPGSVSVSPPAKVAEPRVEQLTDVLQVTVPVTYRERRYGTLMLGMTLDAMRAEVARERLAALGISLAVLLFGTGLSLFFAGLIAAPVVQLRRAADEIAHDNFDVTLPPEGRDEVGALSAAFGHMARRIRESLAELGLRASELATARDEALATATTYRLLFEANPEPMWVYDVETLRFLSVNPAAVRHYGYSRDAFLRMTLRDIRPPSELGRLDDVRTLQPGPAKLENVRHRTRDGREIRVEINSDELDFQGRKARLVLARDVTEHLRLEEELRQAQKMEAVGRLAGGIAHDFNNLLTVITLTVGILLEDQPEGSAEHAHLRDVGEAADRAAALTKQLLAFSRKQVLEPKLVDVNALVAAMDGMLRRIVHPEITLQFTLAAEAGAVMADPGQLEEVILNLVTNARDAMPKGGIITVRTAAMDVGEAVVARHGPIPPGRYCVVSVTDTGTGMDATTKARLFEPFFTTKEMGRGTGMGLASVYGIVKQSGGYIYVESEPGLGSVFTVYLPAAREAAPAATERQAPVATLHGSETILLAEDEEMVRTLTARVLAAHGYQVLAARDGPDALRVAERYDGAIHLLLTDVVMPGMNGRQLADRLTALRPAMKVIYASGYTADAFVAEGVLEPGAILVQKPFTPADLARSVRDVLDGRS